MTGEEEPALPALSGKGGALVAPELLLALTIKHCCERLLADISQAVFGKHKMITTVDIAIGLHYCRPSTSRRHRTDARRFPCPIGEGGIEELYEDAANIFLHPFIVKPTEEISPLFRRDGGITEGRFFCYIAC